MKAYSIERESSPDLDLADYVVELKEGNIPLDEMLSDYGGWELDDHPSLGDAVVRRIGDGDLLKYPW